MKTALAIVGGIALVLLVALLGLFIYTARSGSGLDPSSKAYVDEAIPAIVSPWSVDELKKRASPRMLKAMAQDGLDLPAFFSKLSKLGPLKHYDGSKGEATVFVTVKEGRVVTANYLVHATFDNGDAEMKVGLIQNENQWQILSFFVTSPILLK